MPLAALAVSLLVLRGSFGRVEHLLLALSAVFVAYIVSGLLAHPDWAAAGRGLVVPNLPLTRAGILTVVATIGTTLAPWAWPSSSRTSSTSASPRQTCATNAWTSSPAPR